VNSKLGFGKYLVRSNYTYLNVFGGISNNNEQFSSEQPDNNSFEAFFGGDLNLFDIGDLNLRLKGNAFPSLTESGRWRVDMVFDIKYDLPLDFYIKVGTTYNYDNQPTAGASKSDYVIQSGFGWEW
jgi:hypothetical protein